MLQLKKFSMPRQTNLRRRQWYVLVFQYSWRFAGRASCLYYSITCTVSVITGRWKSTWISRSFCELHRPRIDGQRVERPFAKHGEFEGECLLEEVPKSRPRRWIQKRIVCHVWRTTRQNAFEHYFFAMAEPRTRRCCGTNCLTDMSSQLTRSISYY